MSSYLHPIVFVFYIAEDGDDFAAMVKDMQDVLMQSGGDGENQDMADGRQRPSQGGALPAVVEGDEDDDMGDGFQEVIPEHMSDVAWPWLIVSSLDTSQAALNGRFVLNGEEVPLAVRPSDPLGVKVEALKVFLEQALGSGPFLKVYRRLESLNVDDDEAEVSKEFLNILGQEKLAYLGLVHQLIICEEQAF